VIASIVSWQDDAMDLPGIVAAVRPQLAQALVALDFDGTLAPIVPDPADSRPLPGVLDALGRLAGAGAQVAVVTGRDARTAVDLGGFDAVPGLIVEGLYGLETWHDGTLETPRTPDVVETLRSRLPAAIAAGDDALWIEDKRLSLVVHGRLAADPEAALDPVREPVATLAGELGLEVHPGRGVIELRLPGYDKAGALRRLVERCAPRVVLYAGDDLGDLPALLAVRELRAEGLAAYAIGAGSAEVPEIADAADVLVDGPPGVLELLRDLAR
jgi:trehalose 6-phosphate phosphatase